MILSAMFAASILLADTTPAAAAAAAAVSPPAAANTVSPATVTAAPKAAPANKPRVVCRTEAVTGSMFPKKTCYTTDQMAQRRQDERQNLEHMQNNLGLTAK